MPTCRVCEQHVGVFESAALARPAGASETFVTGDGWFIYNLVTNLSQM